MPLASTAQNMEHVIREYTRACNAADADAIAACFTADATFYFPWRGKWVGAATIGANFAKVVHDYRPDPEGVSDYIRARLAEAERSANQPTLTLENIARDPETPSVADERSDVATREANEASIKRQEAERAAQSGESLPGETASHGSDYIAERLAQVREQEAEREGHGDELAVIERGEGNTPAGGGGRGMF